MKDNDILQLVKIWDSSPLGQRASLLKAWPELARQLAVVSQGVYLTHDQLCTWYSRPSEYPHNMSPCDECARLRRARREGQLHKDFKDLRDRKDYEKNTWPHHRPKDKGVW